jgi:hypothetical protein
MVEYSKANHRPRSILMATMINGAEDAVDVWRSWLVVRRLRGAECLVSSIAQGSATLRRGRSRAGVHL